MMRVERMRQAILQGVPLDLAFAKPALPPMAPPQFGPGGPGGPGGPQFFPPQQGLNFRPTPQMGGPPMGYGANYGGGGRGSGNGGGNQSAGRGRGLLGEFGD